MQIVHSNDSSSFDCMSASGVRLSFSSTSSSEEFVETVSGVFGLLSGRFVGVAEVASTPSRGIDSILDSKEDFLSLRVRSSVTLNFFVLKTYSACISSSAAR